MQKTKFLFILILLFKFFFLLYDVNVFNDFNHYFWLADDNSPSTNFFNPSEANPSLNKNKTSDIPL